ncbi:MAG: class I SAM-dependent methyltransferase [Patescibacteria group bacterium]
MQVENKFEFGKNWQSFLANHFSSESVKASKNRLVEFLAPATLVGKEFVDFGSGSGLHSLSALELGAAKVVSVDVDGVAVQCAKSLKENSPYEKIWQIYKGSLLDQDFMKSLGLFDVVYCWGVAHHTGSMWQALENIAKNVKDGGLLFVAIYNNVEGGFGSRMWYRIKKFYNQSSFFIKKTMEFLYISHNFLILILHLKNPFSVIRNYKVKRGMSWTTDLVDWLGGYPYEYASVKQIFDFYTERGFELKNIKTTNYIGCNQFLFIKTK